METNAGFALFSLPGWRQEKLQVLRWLAHDRHDAGATVTGVLQRALADTDWELRVTAMLAAARLHADALAATIARMPLPRSASQGLSDDELRLVHALRDAALAHLGHGRERALPPGVAQALVGDLTQLRPGMAACVHALAEPLPDGVPPAPQGEGVEIGDTGPRLADGTLLAWVPPLPHWLGDDALRHALPNPPRLHRPAAGFFIDAGHRGTGTLAQALAAAAREAGRLGRAVGLADPDRWEMAARGPDGRRFPWGMNAEPQAWAEPSPWGMAGLTAGAGEWLAAPAQQHAAEGVAAGGRRSPAPARRVRLGAAAVRAYRFVYPAAAGLR